MRPGARILEMYGQPRGPRLGCLADEPAGDGLMADVELASALPAPALVPLWSLVEPALGVDQATTDDAPKEAFCRDHGIDRATLDAALRAVTALYRGAARVALPRDGFARDLETLWPEGTELRATLLDHYDRAVSRLREALLRTSLERHGNVLTDIGWRIDRVMADQDTPRLALPVALLTLCYRNRGRPDELTLQLTASELQSAAKVFAALAQQASRLVPQAAPRPDRGDEPDT